MEECSITFYKMDPVMYLILADKFDEICGCKKDNLVYSLVPSIDDKPEYMRRLYTHNLDKLHLLLDSALSIFGNKKTDVAKKSYPYVRLSEEKESILDTLGKSKGILGLKSINMGDDRVTSALAALSHIYLDSFVYPVQFFLPHSSVCSGQWDFWDKVNYLELIKKIHQKETIKSLSGKLLKSDVWKTKFKAEDFPVIVKRRLLKEKLLGKSLSPEAMIKAIIIRMGELARPSINYEVIDFSIRSFFTYLGVKQYLRMDREIRFLRIFEEEFMKILSDIS